MQRNGASSPAAVDIVDRAGHEPVHHQEKDRLGDVIGGSDAPHWMGMHNVIEMSLGLCLRETRSPERRVMALARTGASCSAMVRARSSMEPLTAAGVDISTAALRVTSLKVARRTRAEPPCANAAFGKPARGACYVIARPR